jgi:hypothetical protein
MCHGTPTWLRLRLLPALGAMAFAVAWSPAAALGQSRGPTVMGDGIFESFETGMGPWTVDAHLPCQVPPDCPPLEYSVTRSQEVAHDGAWSLDFTANGMHDDGTVWIVRPIHLQPGTSNVQLDFQMFSEFSSDVNNWQVVAYIGLPPPQTEYEFTAIGEGGVKGWAPFTYSAALSTLEPTTAYVALGYHISWETWGTHWFDSVLISGVAPTPGDATGDGVVNVDDVVAVILAWGACPVPPAQCPADLDHSGAVDVDDLINVILNWG